MRKHEVFINVGARMMNKIKNVLMQDLGFPRKIVFQR